MVSNIQKNARNCIDRALGGKLEERKGALVIQGQRSSVSSPDSDNGRDSLDTTIPQRPANNISHPQE